jgi:hypothetical protein
MPTLERPKPNRLPSVARSLRRTTTPSLLLMTTVSSCWIDQSAGLANQLQLSAFLYIRVSGTKSKDGGFLLFDFSKGRSLIFILEEGVTKFSTFFVGIPPYKYSNRLFLARDEESEHDPKPGIRTTASSFLWQYRDIQTVA